MSKMREDALQLHCSLKGKLETTSKVNVKNMNDLSLVYSPGVAEPCKKIHQENDDLYEYTMKGNTVAVVTDGTAVLGLGDIGAAAALPVMEGKSILFKNFAGVDAFPLCIDSTDIEQVIQTVKLLQSQFGGINLEDIKSPNCFIIEERLKKELNIPVFHDDQHGTAIVTIAGLINALKLTNKSFETIKVVINGAGAAGIAITKLLHSIGVKEMIMCDSKGAIYKNRPHGMNFIKHDLAQITNHSNQIGTLADVIHGADVFIGVSVAGVLTKEMIVTMNDNPIIFAMANPDPEILPPEAKSVKRCIIGTGRSDYPNQVNNVLAFPGIFRGALDTRATEINEQMKIAAAYAIASLIDDHERNEDYIIPSPFDPRVAPKVALAVAKAAMASGVAQKQMTEQQLKTKAFYQSTPKVEMVTSVL